MFKSIHKKIIFNFIYKQQKQNYFLYMASFGWGAQKGLDVFVRVARKLRKFNFNLLPNYIRENKVKFKKWWEYF